MTNEEIANDWRSRAMSILQWERCPNQAGLVEGEAGGYFVQADGFPRRGYLKPVRPHSDAATVSRAAREKIAADLAHDLGLPVPPVQLVQLDDAPDGCEKAVAVSLIMYPVQHSWSLINQIDLSENPTGLAIARVLSECSPMLVFDTWVDQTDHADHPHNIVWGYDRKNLSDSKIIFLDFAFSMGFRGSWANGDWRNIRIAGFPRKMKEVLRPDDISSTVQKISDMDDSNIYEIVTRIPPSHLDDSQKEVIIEGLCGRKTLLPHVFSSIMNG